jgi:hypothetical protein
VTPIDLVTGYAPLALVAVVLVVGALVAVVRWQQHPGVSMAVLFGCLLFLASVVGFAVVDRFLLSGGMDRLGWMISRWGRAFLQVAGFALLFFAAFGWRQRRDRYERDRYDPRDEPRRDRPERDRRSDEFGAGDRGSENVYKPGDDR